MWKMWRQTEAIAAAIFWIRAAVDCNPCSWTTTISFTTITTTTTTITTTITQQLVNNSRRPANNRLSTRWPWRSRRRHHRPPRCCPSGRSSTSPPNNNSCRKLCHGPTTRLDRISNGRPGRPGPSQTRPTCPTRRTRPSPRCSWWWCRRLGTPSPRPACTCRNDRSPTCPRWDPPRAATAACHWTPRRRPTRPPDCRPVTLASVAHRHHSRYTLRRPLLPPLPVTSTNAALLHGTRRSPRSPWPTLTTVTETRCPEAVRWCHQIPLRSQNSSPSPAAPRRQSGASRPKRSNAKNCPAISLATCRRPTNSTIYWVSYYYYFIYCIARIPF